MGRPEWRLPGKPVLAGMLCVPDVVVMRGILGRQKKLPRRGSGANWRMCGTHGVAALCSRTCLLRSLTIRKLDGVALITGGGDAARRYSHSIS